MLKPTIRLFALIASCAAALPAFSQTCAQADAKLAQSYRAMKRYGNYSRTPNPAKRKHAARTFESVLKNYLRRADSERCPFHAAKEEGLGDTGTVGTMRAFSWDAQNSGTLHNELTLIRFKDAHGRVRFHREESGTTEQILTDRLNGHRVYLLIGSNQVDSVRIVRFAAWYEIRGSRLVPVELFALDKPSYFVNYEHYFRVDADVVRRGYFHYDPATRTFDHPVVKGDVIQPQRMFYRFDGRKFVRTGLKP